MTVKTNYKFSVLFLIICTLEMIAVMWVITDRINKPINVDYPEIERIQMQGLWVFFGLMVISWLISVYILHKNYNRMVKENERRYNAGH